MPTVKALVSQSDTYRPIEFVIAAFVMALWRQRFELATLPVQVFWPGLVVVASLGVAWLIGQILFIRAITDIAVVGMVSAVVLTAYGYRWWWVVSFPLSFLLFAIPMGGPLVPTLVDLTAKFAVLGLQVSGVPIHQEGDFFMIPSGNWSIVEACSGIGYLSTCVMLGCLYAWYLYCSTVKRILFLAGAIAIGVVGNWVRVYLTVIIAHLSDNRLLRSDHSAFGWVVLAIVALLYGYIGFKFRDEARSRRIVASPIEAGGYQQSAHAKHESRPKLLVVWSVTLASLVAWPLINIALAKHEQFSNIRIADIAPQNGWSNANVSFTKWTPELQNPTVTRIQTFAKSGNQVGVFIGIFQNQSWTSKLVTSANSLAMHGDSDWKQLTRGTAETEFVGKPIEVEVGVINGKGTQIVAWRWYWVDGLSTASGVNAKLHQALSRIQGREEVTAWVAIFTEASATPGRGAELLQEFMREMSGPMKTALVVSTRH